MSKCINNSLSIVEKYVNGIDSELKELRNKQSEFRVQIAAYKKIAETLKGQLNNVVTDLDQLDKKIEKEGVTLS